MADTNPRKERLIELHKNNNRVGSEIDEYAGLSKEFPETLAGLDQKEDVKEEEKPQPSTSGTSKKGDK